MIVFKNNNITRTYTQTSNYYNMYICPISSGGFFLLNYNVETLISSSGTESTNPIHINSIRALSIGIEFTIDGDTSFNNNNMESNFNNSR